MNTRPVGHGEMTREIANQSPQDISDEDLLKGHLQCAIDIADKMPEGRRALGEALSAALDTVGGGAPKYHLFGDIREDAALWADCATPIELELYAAAALRRIKRTPFALQARKRLFKMLWDSFCSEVKQRFLRFVEEDA